jgi:hypothetical protein
MRGRHLEWQTSLSRFGSESAADEMFHSKCLVLLVTRLAERFEQVMRLHIMAASSRARQGGVSYSERCIKEKFAVVQLGPRVIPPALWQTEKVPATKPQPTTGQAESEASRAFQTRRATRRVQQLVTGLDFAATCASGIGSVANDTRQQRTVAIGRLVRVCGTNANKLPTRVRAPGLCIVHTTHVLTVDVSPPHFLGIGNVLSVAAATIKSNTTIPAAIQHAS